MNPSILIPAVAALSLVLLERCPGFSIMRRRFLRRYFLTDVVYMVTGYGFGGWIAMSYVSAMTDWARPVVAFISMERLGTVGAVAAALVFLDLGNYVAHMLLHRYEFLWEFHKAHHSSRKLDWLATFRSHLVEQLFRRVLAPVLLIISGFSPEVVAVAAGLFVAWGMLNHSNISVNLEWMERFFITPNLHRLHHIAGSDGQNLGTIFTFWDRMRGTFLRARAATDAVMGVPGEVESYPQEWGPQFIRPFRARVADIIPG